MNTSEYISSGILESYALGLCSEKEAADVERMCALHPEIKTELEEIQASLSDYAASYATTPAPQTRKQVFDEIDRLEAEEQPSGNRGARVIPMARYLAAASIVLLALSLVANVLLYGRWKQANEQVIALNNEKNVLADNLKANQVKLEEMSSSMAVASDPEMTRVMMKGMTKSPESMAVIYWNKQSSEVYLEVKSLPAPAEGMQYQLWAIVDGKPVDAGVLPLTGTDGIHRMKDFATAQAFAITLEKSGGSPVPTLDDMMVMGAI